VGAEEAVLSGLGVATLRVCDVSKAYGPVRALEGVSLSFGPGLTAIVGDNGAGKTTMMKIIAGVEFPSSGHLEIDGIERRFSSPQDARAAGIEALYQDLSLADTLSIAENIFLGRELTQKRCGLRVLGRRRMKDEADRLLATMGVSMPQSATVVRDLSGGQRQAVALGRAIYFDARILLLDEPTAALGPRETATFMALIREVVARGKTVIMVAHDLPMAIDMSESIVVMRAGRVVQQVKARDVSARELNAFIVGASDK
jgi:simple sugar transport system ATP-binding protein